VFIARIIGNVNTIFQEEEEFQWMLMYHVENGNVLANDFDILVLGEIRHRGNLDVLVACI
jgi:hypothetical protein